MNLHGLKEIIGTGRIESAAAVRADGFNNWVEKFLIKANAAINHGAEQAVDEVHGYEKLGCGQNS